MESVPKIKLCKMCGKTKSLTDFWFRNTRRGEVKRYYSPCKACREKRRKQYRKENPLKIKNLLLKRDWNITLEEYHEKVIQQKGVCAICGKPEKSTYRGKPRCLAVDHNHQTGELRGLLCNDCNIALGWFHDDIDVIKNSINYLSFWNKRKGIL